MSWFPELFFEKLPAWFMRVMWPFIVIMFIWVVAEVITFLLVCAVDYVYMQITKQKTSDMPDWLMILSTVIIAIFTLAEIALGVAAVWLQINWAAAILAFVLMIVATYTAVDIISDFA